MGKFVGKCNISLVLCLDNWFKINCLEDFVKVWFIFVYVVSI